MAERRGQAARLWAYSWRRRHSHVQTLLRTQPVFLYSPLLTPYFDNKGFLFQQELFLYRFHVFFSTVAIAPTGVVFVQVVFERIPATTYTHHYVISQDLKIRSAADRQPTHFFTLPSTTIFQDKEKVLPSCI